MIVIELAELLSGRWFSLSMKPGRANQSKFELHSAGWYRGRGSDEMSAYRGVGVYEYKFSSIVSCPIFSSCKYLERILNRGWTLFCGAGVVYESRLAKASTP